MKTDFQLYMFILLMALLGFAGHVYSKPVMPGEALGYGMELRDNWLRMKLPPQKSTEFPRSITKTA